MIVRGGGRTLTATLRLERCTDAAQLVSVSKSILGTVSITCGATSNLRDTGSNRVAHSVCSVSGVTVTLVVIGTSDDRGTFSTTTFRVTHSMFMSKGARRGTRTVTRTAKHARSTYISTVSDGLRFLATEVGSGAGTLASANVSPRDPRTVHSVVLESNKGCLVDLPAKRNGSAVVGRPIVRRCLSANEGILIVSRHHSVGGALTGLSNVIDCSRYSDPRILLGTGNLGVIIGSLDTLGFGHFVRRISLIIVSRTSRILSRILDNRMGGHRTI